jgi:hypothetical protein
LKRKLFDIFLSFEKKLMTVNKILVLITLFSLSFSRLYAEKKMQICAVAFYNLENLFDTLDDPKNWGDNEFLPTGPYNYTGKVYKEKLDNLSHILSLLGTKYTPDGAAIIGTAEIENDRVLQDLVAQPALKGRYQFVHFESPDSRGIDVAMLYNPKYFKVLNARALYVDISKVGKIKGGHTRDVLYVEGILAGDTVHVFVNHWPSRRGGETASAPLRAIAASVSKKVIDSLMAKNPHTRVILMGDLNDDPVSPSVAKVLGAKGDMEKVKTTGMYNPWMKYYKNGYGTLGYNDSWNLFDQIVISGAFLKKNNTDENHWVFYQSEVFKREYMIESFGRYKGYPKRSFSNNQWNNGYSDHFPTTLYFVKPVTE